jgi:cell wall-associated NlpC family hydrolase
MLATAASAETEGQAIVAAAQAIQSQSYPAESFSSAKYIYCWGGGATSGASPGKNDPEGGGTPSGGSYYSDCNPNKGGTITPGDRTGFDCRGLALYSVYQGTGGAVNMTLVSDDAGDQYAKASSYRGSYISQANFSELQPGDLVFFGSSASAIAIAHVGIYVSGTGGNAEIISADSETYGITTLTMNWFMKGPHPFTWAGAVAIPGVGNAVGGGSPPPVTVSKPTNVVNEGNRTYCLDANSNDYANDGDNIQLWGCNTNPEQEWVLTSAGQLQNAGTNMCLDANSNDYPKDGDSIQLWG